MNSFAHNYWVIWLTILVGLFLQIMPWSESFYTFKPHWLMLVLIYWMLALPHRVGMATAFIVGIILDLYSGMVLGVHAFIFSIIAYLTLFKYQLIRNLALWQQSFIIIGLSVCYDLFLLIFQISIYQMITMSPMIFLSSIIDGVLWTWLFLLLQQIKRYFAID